MLTRKLNQPELIWNQDPKLDAFQKSRFFNVDAAAAWKVSKNSECYICDGHKYTVIFFQQGQFTKFNDDLYEVKNESLLKDFKNHY